MDNVVELMRSRHSVRQYLDSEVKKNGVSYMKSQAAGSIPPLCVMVFLM